MCVWWGLADWAVAVRMQFYAVEIARNRAGLNDWIWEKANPEAAKKEKEAEAAKE